LTGATIAADAVGMILFYALLGAGAAARVMQVSVTTQWAIGLPAAWLAGPYLGLGLVGVWGAFIGYRLLQSAIFAGLWSRGRWATIRV
jgi:Na+-driven multidrug efflux pump